MRHETDNNASLVFRKDECLFFNDGEPDCLLSYDMKNQMATITVRVFG